MASSGLWENVILTKTYSPHMGTIYVQQTLVPKGEENWHPRGRTILTNVKNVCVPPMCAMWRGWPIVGGLLEVEG